MKKLFCIYLLVLLQLFNLKLENGLCRGLQKFLIRLLRLDPFLTDQLENPVEVFLRFIEFAQKF